MYPAQFFGLFPPFPRENIVFVAMSFDPRFDARWQNVIAPAIRQVGIGAQNERLEPLRVDARRVSDSILTEILQGISKCRLVVADITTIEKTSTGTPINANVLYEVGIAHATRLAEEVLLFRSDGDALLFDTANIRVNKYDPDGSPKEAIDAATEAIIDALKEIDLRRHLTAQRAADTLTEPALMLLAQSFMPDGVRHPAVRSIRDSLLAYGRGETIEKLLSVGAICAKYTKVTPRFIGEFTGMQDVGLVKYEGTEFGSAVLREAGTRMGFGSTELQQYFEARSAPTKEAPDTNH